MAVTNETGEAGGNVADDRVAYPPLSNEQIEALRAYGTEQVIHAGEVLYGVGDAAPDLILVDSGAIDIVASGPPEVRIARHTAGRFLGELSLLNEQVAFFSARVAVGGRIHRIPPANLRRLMTEDDELSAIILAAFQARRALVKSIASRTVEIVGNRSSAASLALRTYAQRLDIPHTWFEVDSVAGLAMMAEASILEEDLPVVLLPGSRIVRATPGQLSERLGLAYRKRDRSVDLAVVGAGPAGLAAAVYGASEGLSTVLLDAVSPGGQAAASARIENYLGFPNGLSGTELTNFATVQAMKFGAHLYAPCRIDSVDVSRPLPRVLIADGTEIEAGAVIVATGAKYRGLDLLNWNAFEGAGIYYGATVLEAASCEERPVVVVGGANSAGQAALFLASRGCDVSLIIRGADIGAGMSAYLADRLVADHRVRVLTSTDVTALHGTAGLQAITHTNSLTGASERHDCHALFCFIGATPATAWNTGLDLDKDGFIYTDTNVDARRFAASRRSQGRKPLPFESSVAGVFAAGDVRHGSMKRVAAAVGEGASAVSSVHRALASRL
ncbi:FAD-dependent oxidoreductase [Conyzicola nivalis]|uniref:Thioredoxin reductase n=1 Tax=Conyzicola nivalis TaxID=1477021 RepID=A0A916WF64_9MICO|nr:cyclic nucleotide-binding domain-containing thioredoxin-disulfide reductase [Conyzicola nivalis]GGA94857.1 thioredoxin reductase [Conyzicola nivalis]